jgi:hypothetical protein
MKDQEFPVNAGDLSLDIQLNFVKIKPWFQKL